MKWVTKHSIWKLEWHEVYYHVALRNQVSFTNLTEQTNLFKVFLKHLKMPGKIYVLLQWVDKPNAITIMEETEDAKKANEEEIIQIKYPNKGVFKAILLHRSGKY